MFRPAGVQLVGCGPEVEALREHDVEVEAGATPFIRRAGTRHSSIWRGMTVVDSHHQRPLSLTRCSSCLLEHYFCVPDTKNPPCDNEMTAACRQLFGRGHRGELCFGRPPLVRP